MLNEMLEDVVQGSTMEYDLQVAFMKEMEEEVLEEMDWSQEYDWTRTEVLVQILERMEISACMMDKDIDNKAEDECLRSIHCDGRCNKDDCGVGEEEYLGVKRMY